MMAPFNRWVGRVSFAMLLAAVVALISIPHLQFDLRAGSPVGQSLGILAAVLMLGSVFYLLVRRSDIDTRSKPHAQQLHAVIGSIGVATALLHSHAYLRHWSAWVLLAALGLLATGLYGRLLSPQRVGRAFGRSALPFTAAGPDWPKLAIDPLLYEKQDLAGRLSQNRIPERRFVLRLQHWRRHPLLALKFQRLAGRERRLIARHRLCRSVAPMLTERWWRRMHLLMAWLFAIGIVAHVITTVFFAGYVAEGREIYWWHLTDW